MKRKTWLWVLADAAALALLAGLAYVIYLQYQPGGGTERKLPPVVGAQAPDFMLSGLDGQRQSLNDLRGRAVLVNFWATWCLPCKAEMPLLQTYAEKYPDRLVVVGIDVEEAESVVRSYVEKNKFTYPIWLDVDGRTADLFFVKDLPTSFFVDSSGVLKALHIGSLMEEDLVKYLKTIGIE